jgi:hypothetical protein
MHLVLLCLDQGLPHESVHNWDLSRDFVLARDQGREHF